MDCLKKLQYENNEAVLNFKQKKEKEEVRLKNYIY